LIEKQPLKIEYLALSDSARQLLIHFSDSSQASYGPVEYGDVYPAYNIVYGDGKGMPAFRDGQGMPLLGIEKRHAHYDLVDDVRRTRDQTLPYHHCVDSRRLRHIGRWFQKNCPRGL